MNFSEASCSCTRVWCCVAAALVVVAAAAAIAVVHMRVLMRVLLALLNALLVDWLRIIHARTYTKRT